MVTNSNVRRRSSLWLAGSLALVVCLGVGSEGLRSEERRTAALALSHEIGAFPGGIQKEDLTKGWDADDARVRYLLEELFTQRLENAQLSIELARSRAEAAELEEASRQQSALLTASIAALATRHRQEADSRFEMADLQQRLEAAQAELQRYVLENRRLAAELAVAHKAADSATLTAPQNGPVVENETVAGNAVVIERAKQPAELVSAVWFEMSPPMPRQKPRLEETK
jgi:hypothetical protein